MKKVVFPKNVGWCMNPIFEILNRLLKKNKNFYLKKSVKNINTIEGT